MKINIVALWDISTESLLEKEMAQNNKIVSLNKKSFLLIVYFYLN